MMNIEFNQFLNLFYKAFLFRAASPHELDLWRTEDESRRKHIGSQIIYSDESLSHLEVSSFLSLEGHPFKIYQEPYYAAYLICKCLCPSLSKPAFLHSLIRYPRYPLLDDHEIGCLNICIVLPINSDANSMTDNLLYSWQYVFSSLIASNAMKLPESLQRLLEKSISGFDYGISAIESIILR